ncbi:MAG TPA: hypothetical protein VGM53_31285 [Streptosporangiaceae bacterium]|jgi:hypothetical protein
MTEESSTGPVPPYLSFATLLNQVERMEREGTPARIDRSYLVGMAGGTRNQFKMGLRSLGLIDESDQVTDTLARLAKHPEGRQALLAEILRERFPRLVSLDENATRGQLDEILAEYGLGVDTRRKAASFYVAAATYAGIPLSPHIRPAKGVNSGAARRSASTRRPRKRPAAPAAAAVSSQGNGHTVQLKSGGQVALSVSVNVMELSVDDREFIFHLIDNLRAYENGGAPSEPASTPPDGVGL